MFARHSRKDWTSWGDESADEVTPRGGAQRGYGGGEIDRSAPPTLEPHERMSEEVADAVADTLRAFYESGQSLRELCGVTGYSMARVRSLLQRAGADLRPRGGSH